MTPLCQRSTHGKPGTSALGEGGSQHWAHVPLRLHLVSTSVPCSPNNIEAGLGSRPGSLRGGRFKLGRPAHARWRTRCSGKERIARAHDPSTPSRFLQHVHGRRRHGRTLDVYALARILTALHHLAHSTKENAPIRLRGPVFVTTSLAVTATTLYRTHLTTTTPDTQCGRSPPPAHSSL
ncbi:hypothetical protein VTO73DRAFT_13921 [Trametes versicolor]